ncbi:MAG: TonB-dependent receptor, partial [Chitinophagaceae bacterium]|nr:TonB-dependent receptor [Chitinophagaceae bacterium]
QMDVFANYARNRFDFQPQSSQQAFGVINQAFLLSMYFEGSETDKFDSRYGGISFTNTVKNNMILKFIASGFQTNETETYDIYGQYNLGQLETDLGKENFGTVKVSLGDGAIHNYARNYLKINVGNLGHKGSLDKGKHFLQWGANSEFVSIRDQLNEWERRDSAGFSLPYSDSVLKMFSRYKTSQDFTYARLSGYLQDNIELDSQRLVMTAGMRFNYNQLNNEFLLSPRLQLSYKPTTKKDIVYKIATGFYHQPPFYREMRALDGSVNKQVKAQRSFHAVAGFDYNFKGFYEKPFKFTTELFYKNMWNVVPYEIDNVRIRYFGTNNAKAFAYGAEFRLYGDLVKDAESFVSVALMNTKEDILNDVINVKSKIDGSDSTKIFPGYIPRPTDSRINVGLFFSDYLRNNKNFKVYINGLYGTGLPFGPPDNQRYGDTLRIPSYKRVDIGFAALLLDKEKKERPHYSIFKHVETAWLSLEVFNLLGIKNTLSYLWIRDNSSNNTYAVPNRLTARLLNAKLVVKF